jgi:hypothetical protein
MKTSKSEAQVEANGGGGGLLMIGLARPPTGSRLAAAHPWVAEGHRFDGRIRRQTVCG